MRKIYGFPKLVRGIKKKTLMSWIEHHHSSIEAIVILDARNNCSNAINFSQIIPICFFRKPVFTKLVLLLS